MRELKPTGTGKGYAAVLVHPRWAQAMYKALELAGMEDLQPANKYHCTLMYDESNPNLDPNVPAGAGYKARVTGVDTLGEGEWQGLVIKLECRELQDRFKALQARGYKHSYPDLLLHISVKYKPKPGDIDILKQCLDKAPTRVPLFAEYWEPIKE